LGTPALTSRNFKEKDFVQVADFIHEAIEIYVKHKDRAGKTVKEFKEFLEKDQEFLKEVKALGERVEKFTEEFDIPGNEEI
jgi:glycine hydroxymethyltransferase